MQKRVAKITLSMLLLLSINCSITVNRTTLDFGTTETTKTFTLTPFGFFDWSISCNKDWVTVNPDQGQSGQLNKTINVNVDRTGLTAGNYTATLKISNNWEPAKPPICNS